MNSGGIRKHRAALWAGIGLLVISLLCFAGSVTGDDPGTLKAVAILTGIMALISFISTRTLRLERSDDVLEREAMDSIR